MSLDIQRLFCNGRSRLCILVRSSLAHNIVSLLSVHPHALSPDLISFLRYCSFQTPNQLDKSSATVYKAPYILTSSSFSLYPQWMVRYTSKPLPIGRILLTPVFQGSLHLVLLFSGSIFSSQKHIEPNYPQTRT